MPFLQKVLLYIFERPWPIYWMFSNPWAYMHQFWHHQICKHYQDIICILLFTIIFEIHYYFFIVLTIRLKICRSYKILLCSFLQGKMCAPDHNVNTFCHIKHLFNLFTPCFSYGIPKESSWPLFTSILVAISWKLFVESSKSCWKCLCCI